jgi:putative nucleotidyltransferase with HDIG domain
VGLGSAGAAAFVQALSDDLNSGKLRLPSLPAVTLRVRRALDDEACDVDKLARLVASEPMLAARILKVANSAMLSRGGHAVTDSRTAINRLGFRMVRNAAMAVALEQLVAAEEFRAISGNLQELWRHSVNVAALSYVLAKLRTQLNPDEALLAGLVHDIGKLYIWTRINVFRDPDSSEADFRQVVKDWHPAVGQAILESWDFPEEICAAAGGHEEFGDGTFRPTNLTDVVSVANYLANTPAGAELDAAAVGDLPAFQRLRIGPAESRQVLQASRQEIQSLTRALSA